MNNQKTVIMNKKKIGIVILFCGIVTLLTTACTQKGGAPLYANTDSVFNGSFLQISYYDTSNNLISYYSKDVVVAKTHLVAMTCLVNKIDSLHDVVSINIHSPYSLYEVPAVDFYIL